MLIFCLHIFIARELSKLDPLTFAIDVQDEEDFTPDEHTAILTGTSTAAGNQDEQKEVFDAMERAGDNLVAAVEKAKKMQNDEVNFDFYRNKTIGSKKEG